MRHSRDIYWEQAIKSLENKNECLFLTWKAWTWKSTLINDFVEEHPELNILLLAPTGIAAQNIRGVTIHNAMKFKYYTTPHSLPDISIEKENLLRAADMIIIDEVSMVSAHLLDCVDQRLQWLGHWYFWLPFGWKKIVLVWDLYQLPPVMEQDNRARLIYDETYWSKYFFWANVFAEFGWDNWKIIELEKVYRQENSWFLDMLNKIREWKCDQKIIDKLNKCVWKKLDWAITLTTTNKAADKINKEESFSRHKTFQIYLPTDYKVYDNYNSKDEYRENQRIVKDLNPFEECVKLRHWDQIIITLNQPRPEEEKNNIHWKPEFVNWDMWEFVAFKRWFPDYAYVRLYKDWKIHRIKKIDYQIEKQRLIWNKYEYDAIWLVRWYPFKRAYALTIHKSQWQTYDKAIIDFGRWTFEYGQAYVALSRIKSMDWLSLSRPIECKDVYADESVLKFLEDKKLILWK